MLQRSIYLLFLLACYSGLHAQTVDLSRNIAAPSGNIITTDWLASRPHNAKVMAIIPADFSAPPRLLLSDPIYLNEYRRHGSPSWSQDGTRIVVEVMKDAPRKERLLTAHIVTARPDGTDIKDIGLGIAPDISPDGKQIVYQKMDTPPRIVQLMDWDGNNRRPLPHKTLTQGCQWSPDGNSIVVLAGTGGLDLVDVHDQTSIEIVPHIGFGHLWKFAWTPDGKKLFFLLYRTQPTVVDEYDLTLNMIDLSDTSKGIVEFPEAYLSEPSMTVSPDGERIVYAHDGVLQEIEIAKPDSSPRPVKGQFADFSYGDAAYSHDGKWIAVAIN